MVLIFLTSPMFPKTVLPPRDEKKRKKMKNRIKKEYRVLVLSKKFEVRDMPIWMYKLDHGTNFATGYVDIYVSSKIVLKRIRKFFRNKKIKLRITSNIRY